MHWNKQIISKLFMVRNPIWLCYSYETSFRHFFFSFVGVLAIASEAASEARWSESFPWTPFGFKKQWKQKKNESNTFLLITSAFKVSRYLKHSTINRLEKAIQIEAQQFSPNQHFCDLHSFQRIAANEKTFIKMYT